MCAPPWYIYGPPPLEEIIRLKEKILVCLQKGPHTACLQGDNFPRVETKEVFPESSPNLRGPPKRGVKKKE